MKASGFLGDIGIHELHEPGGELGGFAADEPSREGARSAGEAERSEGAAGWVAGAECKANPPRASISTNKVAGAGG